MWSKIASFILRNRFFILGVITLLTVFFGFHAITGLKLDNKYGILLPKDSPTTRSYRVFKEHFGEDGGSLAIAIQTDSLYTQENFLKWKELGDSILQFDGVDAVISEATLFTIRNNIQESRFEAKRIFSDITFQEKSVDSIEKEIKSNPVYEGLLYNDSANVSLMMVTINEQYLSDGKKSKVVTQIEELSSTYEKYFGKVHFAGLPHLRVIIAKRIQGEMFFFIALSLLITALLLYVFFRSFRVVMICLTVVAIAVIWAMGSMAFMGFRLSILMALIPPLMIVIGVPNCTYLMTKFHQEVKEHGNKIKALSRVIQKIGTATFLTNFTTALGFLTFAFTNSEKLFEFGVTASINVMMVFVLSLCILPIFASFSKTPKERHLRHLDRKFASGLIRTILYLTQYRRTAVYLTTIGIVVVSIMGLVQIRATGNITSDLPEGDPILTDLKFIEKNFGGSIPFEVMIGYKEPGRLFKRSTLERIESVQENYKRDTLFSKSISVVDFIKVINMAYYRNDPSKYELISNRDRARLKKYIDNFDMTNPNGSGLSVKELLDTVSMTVRVRCQMKDLGSYEVADKVDAIRGQIDSIMNPDKPELERLFGEVRKGKKEFIDSILYNHSGVYSALTKEIAGDNSELMTKLDSDPELIKTYYAKSGFNDQLRQAIDHEYFDITLTGTSVVASEGTRYMVNNLFSSILFAIVSISLLMALLFRSWRMVVVAMVPNLIPLVVTAGIMGWAGIPLKPSTLLVFSIALGISVDDTIHYLAKYRQELKYRHWDIKECVLVALRESGLGMFYTSIVLFCGFSVFMFSQFGGTQALGLLISVTLLIAMVTNLLILPSLLLTLNKVVTSKSFVEPYFEAYTEESEIDWSELQLSTDEDLGKIDPAQPEEEDKD
jgi:predicted RND superfamily exporter protein